MTWDRVVWCWCWWERLTGVVSGVCVAGMFCLYALGWSHAGHALSFDQFAALVEKTWKWATKGWQ